MCVPYLWLIPTKDLQNVKTHKPIKAALTQIPHVCNRKVAGFRMLALYVYYKPFASVEVVLYPTCPDIVESTAMRDGVLGSPDRPSDENSENEDKDVDEDGEWSTGVVTMAWRMEYWCSDSDKENGALV